jgi:serine/threonine-protein phosphatase Stp1
MYQDVSVDDLGAALNLPSPQLTLNRLFQQALDGPARDNLSAVVIRR